MKEDRNDQIKLVILDRDGVINKEQGHITSIEKFEILEGVLEAISVLNKLGVKVCVASNQSGLARGILSEEVLGGIQAYFEQELRNVGGWIDHWFYSPWHPEKTLAGGVVKWLGEHEDRKPGTGMLRKALEVTGVCVEEALMVGDSGKDLQAAESLGMRFMGVRSAKERELEGQLVYNSLKEVVDDLGKGARFSENDEDFQHV